MSDRIHPDLQTAILCEEVRQEMTGNFILIGVLGNVSVPALPITAFKLCLFTRWCCGVGKFKHKYRIVLPDDTNAIATVQGEFELKSTEELMTQVTMFGNVQFQQAGTHWVECYLDEKFKLRFPLSIRLIPPNPS
jgi:hypothetical protein